MEPRLPAISAELDRHCGAGNWRVVGASALVYHGGSVWLEITRPRAWLQDANGIPIVTLGGIGGGLEAGESPADCLRREGREELNVALHIESQPHSWLILNGRLLPERLGGDETPRPWFYTAARNRRPAGERDVETLVIVTYRASAADRPAPHDLYGLLAVPQERLCELLTPQPAPLVELCRRTGAELLLNGTLPAGALLQPILTAESARLLLCGPAGPTGECP